jgi:hypothetical protein
MPKKESKNIKFKYVFPEGLRDLYVNGVYGGLTFENKIVMHLFSERTPIPEEETYSLAPEGNLGEKINAKTGGDVIRLVQCTAIMEPGTAQALINWLQDKLDALSKQKGKTTEKKK